VNDIDKGRLIGNILASARLAHDRKVAEARNPYEMRRIPPYSAGSTFLALACMSDQALLDVAKHLNLSH
jgi:hypothetical protein